MVRPPKFRSVNENRAQRVEQQKRAAISQPAPPRPPPEEPSRHQPEKRRNNRTRQIERADSERLQRRGKRDDEIIKQRRRVRHCSLRKIFKRMVPQDEPRMLKAHSRARHARIAIGVGKINVAVNENVLMIRAARHENERGKQNDLNNRDNGPSHPAVLIENVRC